MNPLNEISAPIQSAMEEFNVRFRASLKTDSPLLDYIIKYILKRKGKQIRPMFVFLSSLLNGQITPSTHHAASLIELLHTATLVHDDVVDESDQRRGLFSVNALWKNKAAVLVGDYLLSRGLSLSLQYQEHTMLEMVSHAVKEMSEGELMQIEKARFLNITEDAYLDIIRKKTASLLAVCCSCGAFAAGASKEQVDRMHYFGQQAGIAFQIKDDLFDFETSGKTGKPTGIDLQERKMSLPVIYHLNHTSYGERRHIINLIKNHNQEPEKMALVIDKVLQGDGIAYATKRMNDFRDQAIGELRFFPDGPAKNSLEQLLIFTTERSF